MAEQQNIPAAWIGAEQLPLHFANAFGVTGAQNAIFMFVGSIMPATAEDPGQVAPPFVPITPIAKLALAPAAIPQLITGLEGALKQHEAAASESKPKGD